MASRRVQVRCWHPPWGFYSSSVLVCNIRRSLENACASPALHPPLPVYYSSFFFWFFPDSLLSIHRLLDNQCQNTNRPGILSSGFPSSFPILRPGRSRTITTNTPANKQTNMDQQTTTTSMVINDISNCEIMSFKGYLEAQSFVIDYKENMVPIIIAN